MAAFPLEDLGKVKGHPAKGMTWSKSAIIIKRIPFPKGAVPAHLRPYAEKFASAAKTCRGQITKGKGADTVRAMNECMRGQLKK